MRTKSADIAELQSAILTDAAFPLEAATRVLDVGCGNGSVVKAWLAKGMDAYGCDFRFKTGPHVDELERQGRICRIPTAPYRLPYPDAHFDLVVTDQVMEHVRDYDTTLAEMRRVLKPNGCSLHFFPARGNPIEPHVFVPFANVIQSRAWLTLWAYLGVRKSGQRDLSPREVAEQNHTYLTTSTNYLTARQLQRYFSAYFREVRFVEDAFLKHSPNKRGRTLYEAGRRLPLLFPLYRACWARVILARR